MLQIVGKNQVTGIVSPVTRISNANTYDYMKDVIEGKRTATKDFFVFELGQYKYVASNYISFLNGNANEVSGRIWPGYLSQVVQDIDGYIRDQTQGYFEFSHYVQYFISAIHQSSTITTSNFKNPDELVEKMRAINGAVSLLSLRASYFRYLVERRETQILSEINLFSKMVSFSASIDHMGETHNRGVVHNVIGDRNLVVQAPDVFDFIPFILLENAVKYGPASGVGLAISISREASGALLEVGSMGAIVTDEEQSRLFSRGFRASAAEQLQKQGTGLGLYQAKLGASRMFGGTVNFRQSGPVIHIDGLKYRKTIVSIWFPSNCILR